VAGRVTGGTIMIGLGNAVVSGPGVVGGNVVAFSVDVGGGLTSGEPLTTRWSARNLPALDFNQHWPLDFTHV